MSPSEKTFHPDLQRAARFLPRTIIFPRQLWLSRLIGRLIRMPRPPEDVAMEEVRVPGPAGAPPVRVRLYRPRSLARPSPALLWLHPGGYIVGRIEEDGFQCATLAKELGVLVVSVDYRLAPEHPFPAALEDCYAALRWLSGEAGALGVLPERIAIGGMSAGAGLAAALAQVAHDRGQVRPVAQVLLYPMLDDRTATRTGLDSPLHRIWNQASNVFGWTSYLGRPPGGAEVPEHAVPARRKDLSGLPPAWMGVGTLDLFHDEDVEYAQRLKAAGVPCELVVVPGAYHGFDSIVADAQVSRDFHASYVGALRRALFPQAT